MLNWSMYSLFHIDLVPDDRYITKHSLPDPAWESPTDETRRAKDEGAPAYESYIGVRAQGVGSHQQAVIPFFDINFYREMFEDSNLYIKMSLGDFQSAVSDGFDSEYHWWGLWFDPNVLYSFVILHDDPEHIRICKDNTGGTSLSRFGFHF